MIKTDLYKYIQEKGIREMKSHSSCSDGSIKGYEHHTKLKKVSTDSRKI